MNQLSKESEPSKDINDENIPMVQSNINEANKDTYELITVAQIKGKLYKNYLDKVLRIDTEIKLCRNDKNQIVIYSGPYESLKNKDEMLKIFRNKNFNNSYLTSLNFEEFNRHCNY